MSLYYENIIREIVEDAYENESPIQNDNDIFYDPISGKIFMSSKEFFEEQTNKVAKRINKELAEGKFINGSYAIDELFKELGITNDSHFMI